MTNKDKIIEAFNKVRKLGWVESHRKNNTGIGKTFEDCIGVVENNLNESDLFGFEIKSHRDESSSFVTLFTKSPSFPRIGANARLREKFGDYYPDNTMKKLHTSIYADFFNSFMNRYSFRLIHKPEEQRIYIGVFTIDTHTELDCTTYYSYRDIQTALANKLHNLFFVKAKRRINEVGTEFFFFDSAEIYSQPSLQKFLELLDIR